MGTLITSGTGYIGSHTIIETLKKGKIEIISTENSTYSSAHLNGFIR